jgi:hypothetical protein
MTTRASAWWTLAVLVTVAVAVVAAAVSGG